MYELDTKEPELLYRARKRRSEVDGKLYKPGDETDLSGLTLEQRGYVVANGFYMPLFTPDEELQAAIDKARGG